MNWEYEAMRCAKQQSHTAMANQDGGNQRSETQVAIERMRSEIRSSHNHLDELGRRLNWVLLDEPTNEEMKEVMADQEPQKLIEYISRHITAIQNLNTKLASIIGRLTIQYYGYRIQKIY